MQTHSIINPLSSFTLSSFPSSLSPRPQTRKPHSRKIPSFQSPKPLHLCKTPSHVLFSTPIDDLGGSSDLELLGKPSLIPHPDDGDDPSEPQNPPDFDEALAPFLKFFKARDPDSEEEIESETPKPIMGFEKEVEELVAVEYYDPKPGDLVVGVVVSGNENKLDVNIGADFLGTMLTKEVLPLYDGEMSYLLCDLGNDKDEEEFMVKGRIGVVKDEDAMSGGGVPGRPVVEVGTVLFAEVLGRTLSGRPLLSSRRLFRRIAWHRARQVSFSPSLPTIFVMNTSFLGRHGRQSLSIHINVEFI